MQCDASIERPLVESSSRELWPVVDDDRSSQASLGRESIEHTCHALAWYRACDFDRDALAAERRLRSGFGMASPRLGLRNSLAISCSTGARERSPRSAASTRRSSARARAEARSRRHAAAPVGPSVPGPYPSLSRYPVNRSPVASSSPPMPGAGVARPGSIHDFDWLDCYRIRSLTHGTKVGGSTARNSPL